MIRHGFSPPSRRALYKKLKLENGEQRQLVDKIFQSSTESTVPYFVGIAEFLTNIMPFVCQSFKLMMEWYNIRPTFDKAWILSSL